MHFNVSVLLIFFTSSFHYFTVFFWYFICVFTTNLFYPAYSIFIYNECIWCAFYVQIFQHFYFFSSSLISNLNCSLNKVYKKQICSCFCMKEMSICGFWNSEHMIYDCLNVNDRLFSYFFYFFVILAVCRSKSYLSEWTMTKVKWSSTLVLFVDSVYAFFHWYPFLKDEDFRLVLFISKHDKLKFEKINSFINRPKDFNSRSDVLSLITSILHNMLTIESCYKWAILWNCNVEWNGISHLSKGIKKKEIKNVKNFIWLCACTFNIANIWTNGIFTLFFFHALNLVILPINIIF